MNTHFTNLQFEFHFSGVILDYLLETLCDKFKPNFYSYVMAGMLIVLAYTYGKVFSDDKFNNS